MAAAIMGGATFMGFLGVNILVRWPDWGQGAGHAAIINVVWGSTNIAGCLATTILAARILRAGDEAAAPWWAIPTIILGWICVSFGPILGFRVGLRSLIVIGVVSVVTLGALGLVLRAVGELKGSARWKAAGYLVGASAYIVTASVSLSAAAHVLPSQ